MVRGWYQVAFERDLSGTLNSVSLGVNRLLLVRINGEVRAFDLYCPHRGADLSVGGRLDAETIVCPFHKFRIGLALGSSCEFSLKEYACFAVGGLVFVRLSPHFDFGFSRFMQEFMLQYTIFPGYTIDIKAPATLIIENGFDETHFLPVHGIRGERFQTRTHSDGKLELTAELILPKLMASNADSEEALPPATPILLTAFSPGLSVLKVDGNRPYTMLLGATPTHDGKSQLRVTVALPKSIYGDRPSMEIVEKLLHASKEGIKSDQVIWENLSSSSQPQFTQTDRAVLKFREFCLTFETGMNEDV